METIISLLRNLLCVLKSLLADDHYVMQPFMTFPSIFQAQALESFSSLDGMIALLQFAGAGFNLVKGFQGLFGGIMVAENVVRWRNALADFEEKGEEERREVGMLSEVLARQDASNNRRIVVGICQLIIGVGLAQLMGFSLKVVGVVSVAAGVAIMEVALAALLLIAILGVAKVQAVARKVKSLEEPTGSDVDIVEFLAPLAATVGRTWEPNVSERPSMEVLRLHMDNMGGIAKVISETRLENYQRLARVAERQALLDSFLIALNVVAFLGYGFIPLVVFYPDKSMLVQLFPHWPGDYAWWGNLAGDVAWTIEPVVMMVGPRMILSGAQPQTVGKAKTE